MQDVGQTTVDNESGRRNENRRSVKRLRTGQVCIANEPHDRRTVLVRPVSHRARQIIDRFDVPDAGQTMDFPGHVGPPFGLQYDFALSNRQRHVAQSIHGNLTQLEAPPYVV